MTQRFILRKDNPSRRYSWEVVDTVTGRRVYVSPFYTDAFKVYADLNNINAF